MELITLSTDTSCFNTFFNNRLLFNLHLFDLCIIRIWSVGLSLGLSGEAADQWQGQGKTHGTSPNGVLGSAGGESDH